MIVLIVILSLSIVTLGVLLISHRKDKPQQIVRTFLLRALCSALILVK
jgi:uncharacterized membrane protein